MTNTDQPKCWTCGGDPSPTNFGGLCDTCTATRKARTVAGAKAMDRHNQHGHNAEAIRTVARRYGYKG